jgi:ribosome recycling factor
MHQVLEDIADKMQKSIETYQKELIRIRTGRASLSILDPVRVQAYGSPMPLNQVASLTIPESRTIAIQPWDLQLVGEIEKAVYKADLGLNPVSDGKIIRINIPQLTEERRKELVKQVKKISEEYRVAIRNLRREAIDLLKKLKKDKELSEDEQFKLQDEVQKTTDGFIGKIDDMMAEKEKEVMEV